MHPDDEPTMKQLEKNREAHTHHDTMNNVAESTGAFDRSQPRPPPIVHVDPAKDDLEAILKSIEESGEPLEEVDEDTRGEVVEATVEQVIELLGGKLAVDNVRGLINQECQGLRDLLLEENASYGNSFAQPIGIFARGLTAEEQVNVRIDDKLCRIARGHEFENEDTELDLIGYLILKRVLRRLSK